MITISAKISGTFYTSVLPWSKNWAIKISKPQVTKLSLAGTSIHQSQVKSITAGTVEYSGRALESEADTLETIDRGATTCTLSDGENVYTINLDAKVGKHVEGGRKEVSFTATIVSELYA